MDPPLKGRVHDAAALGISDLGTKGGLRTDARARVLRPDGTPYRAKEAEMLRAYSATPKGTVP